MRDMLEGGVLRRERQAGGKSVTDRDRLEGGVLQRDRLEGGVLQRGAHWREECYRETGRGDMLAKRKERYIYLHNDILELL